MVEDSNRVELVWNKGIAARCDRRFPDEFPDGGDYSPVPTHAGALFSSRLPDNLISDPSESCKIEDGDLVWVRISWLRSFVRQVLPLVKANFILATGDSDSCVPSELGPDAQVVLASSKVLHWCTQNYDGSMNPARISPLPIGIDFHSLSEAAIWGEHVTSPLEQERELLSIGKSLPSLLSRIPRVYADFGSQRGLRLFHYRRYHPLVGTNLHEDRWQIAKELRSNELVYFQSASLPRGEKWRQRGQYAFVLSPPGMGLDCHRTWECLALGHIVLTPSSSLDALYEGLPVVTLRSWDEITPQNLERWLSRFGQGRVSHGKLKSAYWANAMRLTAEEQIPPDSSTTLPSLTVGKSMRA